MIWQTTDPVIFVNFGLMFVDIWLSDSFHADLHRWSTVWATKQLIVYFHWQPHYWKADITSLSKSAFAESMTYLCSSLFLNSYMLNFINLAAGGGGGVCWIMQNFRCWGVVNWLSLLTVEWSLTLFCLILLRVAVLEILNTLLELWYTLGMRQRYA